MAKKPRPSQAPSTNASPQGSSVKRKLTLWCLGVLCALLPIGLKMALLDGLDLPSSLGDLSKNGDLFLLSLGLCLTGSIEIAVATGRKGWSTRTVVAATGLLLALVGSIGLYAIVGTNDAVRVLRLEGFPSAAYPWPVNDQKMMQNAVVILGVTIVSGTIAMLISEE